MNILLSECESIVEPSKKGNKSEGREDEEKDTQERASARGVLESGLEISPMEKGFNGLARRTDMEVGTVPGTQDVIAFSLPWRNDFNISVFFQIISPIRITISPVCEQAAKRNRSTVSIDLLCSQQIRVGCRRDLSGPEQGESAWSEHDKDMEFHAMIPLLTCGIVAFVTETASNFCTCAVRAPGGHDGAGVHGIVVGITALFHRFLRPNFRQCLESRRKTVQPPAKSLVAGQSREPRQQVAFGVVVDRLSRW